MNDSLRSGLASSSLPPRTPRIPTGVTYSPTGFHNSSKTPAYIPHSGDIPPTNRNTLGRRALPRVQRRFGRIRGQHGGTEIFTIFHQLPHLPRDMGTCANEISADCRRIPPRSSICDIIEHSGYMHGVKVPPARHSIKRINAPDRDSLPPRHLRIHCTAASSCPRSSTQSPACVGRSLQNTTSTQAETTTPNNSHVKR